MNEGGYQPIAFTDPGKLKHPRGGTAIERASEIAGEEFAARIERDGKAAFEVQRAMLAVKLPEKLIVAMESLFLIGYSQGYIKARSEH